jgi:hypothetical protein
MDHPAPPFPLADPVIQFDSDLDPHWSRLGWLVNVKMSVLVAMNVDIAENLGVATARQSNRWFWATDGRLQNHDFG